MDGFTLHLKVDSSNYLTTNYQSIIYNKTICLLDITVTFAKLFPLLPDIQQTYELFISLPRQVLNIPPCYLRKRIVD